MLTQARLKEVLDYDPETGMFTWKVDRPPLKAGDQAGSLRRDGYVIIRIKSTCYRVHRLAWLWMTGEWPKEFLDHKNMDKADNRWSNLRNATKSQNAANTSLRKDNTSGIKGVRRFRDTDRWIAQIQKDGKNYFLGHFDTKEEAHEARRTKQREFFGEFAR